VNSSHVACWPFATLCYAAEFGRLLGALQTYSDFRRATICSDWWSRDVARRL
jgi:hypothetical protein